VKNGRGSFILVHSSRASSTSVPERPANRAGREYVSAPAGRVLRSPVGISRTVPVMKENGQDQQQRVNPAGELHPLTAYDNSGFKPATTSSRNNRQLKSPVSNNGADRVAKPAPVSIQRPGAVTSSPQRQDRRLTVNATFGSMGVNR
jgi:hypothetical protein